MKLKVLFESDSNITYEEIKEALKPCIPFLKEFRLDFDNGYYLVRGMQEKDNIVKKTTKENRKPKDSSIRTHNSIDTLFKKHLGHKFRSNKVAFCKIAHEDNESGVADYGTPYRIFPIGANYKFCYSTLIDDFYDNIDNNVVYNATNKNSKMKKALADFFVTEFKNLLKKSNGTKLFKIDRTMIDENIATFADDLAVDYFSDSNRFAITRLNFSDYVVQIDDNDHYDIAEHAEILDKFEKNFRHHFSNDVVHTKFADILFQFLEYTTELHNLQDACIESSHRGRIVEVMMNCDEYIAICRNNVDYEKNYDNLKKAIKDLIK